MGEAPQVELGSIAHRGAVSEIASGRSDGLLQGLGIALADQERIFEKFSRLDPALTRGVGGTGLGLYIARELIARMGGTIRVASIPGEGSRFTVELPLERVGR